MAPAVTTINSSEKGEAIRFIDGIYEGMAGWYEKGRAPTPKMYYVIVDKGEGNGIKTRVARKSMADATRPITDPFTAALARVPTLEREIKAMCKTLVMCKITEISADITDFIQETLTEAAAQNKGTKSRPALVYDIDVWASDDVSVTSVMKG
jgi:hypothetical protein